MQSVPEIRWLLLGVVFTVAIILISQGVAGIRTRISGAGGRFETYFILEVAVFVKYFLNDRAL